MQGLIKINNNQYYSRIQERLQCSDAVARTAYIDKLTTKRIFKTVAEAEIRMLDESGLWKDGYMVELRRGGSRIGGLEIYHFLFIELEGAYSDSQKTALLQNKTEFINAWDEQSQLVARSLYRFPYWDYLAADEIAKVRDPLMKFQPLVHRVFSMRDFEVV